MHPYPNSDMADSDDGNSIKFLNKICTQRLSLNSPGSHLDAFSKHLSVSSNAYT